MPVPSSCVAEAGEVPVVAAAGAAPARCGEPQTLQYPSSYVPVQPSSAHGTAVVDVLMRPPRVGPRPRLAGGVA